MVPTPENISSRSPGLCSRCVVLFLDGGTNRIAGDLMMPGSGFRVRGLEMRGTVLKSQRRWLWRCCRGDGGDSN